MKILVANRHLKSLGGSETFTYTLIAELHRRGHQVEYFTLYRGLTSQKIEELGVLFATGVNYDLILAGQVDTISELRRQCFTGPVIQICHGCVTPGEQPHPLADGYIAISFEVVKHLESKGYDSFLVVNGIDCHRFRPRSKVRKKIKVIASMAQTEEAHSFIVQAADKIGAQVIRLNKYHDQIWDVEKEINKADLVVSLGRGCYEAMACGRPVVIFDKRRYQAAMGDGYVTNDNFLNFLAHNCSGRFSKQTFTVDDLVGEFQKYNADDSQGLRQLALGVLNVKQQVECILDISQSYMDNYNYPGNTDVVYVLGKGSRWADNEIRYSIRSFKKHFKDIRNIVVVGQRPEWMQGVIHIPCPDNLNLNKDARMIEKVLRACKDPRVSDQFIYCTDDTFLNADLNFSDFTGWHEGPIMYDAEADLADHRRVGDSTQNLNPSNWFNYVYNTGEELIKRGLPDNNYDRAHCPQPIDKQEYIQIMKQWDYKKNYFTNQNIYLNTSEIFTGEDIRGKNAKIYNPLTAEEIDGYLSDKIVFNINDNGLTDLIRDMLQVLFPESSCYELFNHPTNKRKAVTEWFQNGCKYNEGVALVEHFAPKNRQLIKFLQYKQGTHAGEVKLKNTLRIWLR